jgi:hypothetical protein
LRPPNIDELADERCAGFPQPERDPAPIGGGAGLPVFGACGHVYSWQADGVDVYSPDFTSIVARSQDLPKFSPEGTRLAFTPRGADRGIVRRLDLVSGQSFDTPAFDSEPTPTSLGYGLFVDDQGAVQSWVCSQQTLRIFADHEPSQQATFEREVPSCKPDFSGSVLLWRDGSSVLGIDLPKQRVYQHTLPEHGSGVADGIHAVLDGYAFALQSSADGENQPGPLYSTRTGEKLAEQWEEVLGDASRAAINRTAPDVALLFDTGEEIRAQPGLRGLYPFRDRSRAFGLRHAAAGRTELVLADLTTGELTPIARYSEVADGARLPRGFGMGVSPHETAAYFLGLPDEAPSAAANQRRSLSRWFDGRGARLADSIDPSAWVVLVADDGTAVINAGSGTYRVSPDVQTLLGSPIRSSVLNANGTQVCGLDTIQETGPYLAELALIDVASGAKRVLGSGVTSATPVVTDRDRQRVALVAAKPGGAAQLWLGRLP